MKFVKFIIPTLVLLALPSISYAKEYTVTVDFDFYTGGSYGFMGYQISGAETADIKTVYLQGGVTVYDWLTTEVRVGHGLNEDKAYKHAQGVDMGIKVSYFYGMYAKVGYPYLDIFYPYAMLGKTIVKSKIDIEGYDKVSGTESGMSVGGGLDFKLSGLNSMPTWFNFTGFDFEELDLPANVALNVEYIQYFNKESISIGAINVGVKYLF